tara:strand:- start:223 stop:1488 length:1266 start_codon:yes stop_codon:yes gene_type:complete
MATMNIDGFEFNPNLTIWDPKDYISKMSKEDADARATWALKSNTFGPSGGGEDHLNISNALQGLNEWGEAIQEGDDYWDLALNPDKLVDFAKQTKKGAAVDTIMKNNPALLMGAEGRANMGNFGGQAAIDYARDNVGSYVDSSGLTDQYQTDVDAGLGGQTNEWNLGGRTRPDGSLRPESDNYNKTGKFEAPEGTPSSYGPGSGPFAAESNRNPPDLFEIPAGKPSLGPAGYTYDEKNQTITNPETGVQHDPNTGLDDGGPGNPQVQPSPVDFNNVPLPPQTSGSNNIVPSPTPPLGGNTATPPPSGGGDMTTQGGSNWYDGYASGEDWLAANPQGTESKGGGFGGSFDDFMKFMMMMNFMGGGMGGRGGYGGSQYGYGGLNPGGVQSAYNPLEQLQGSWDWFGKNFGSGGGVQGGTTANI